MITPKQIAALKYLVSKSLNGTDLMKRIIFLMIDSSKGLSVPVSITIMEIINGYSRREIQAAILSLEAMNSCNENTHLNEMLALAGSDFLFTVHYGHYEGDKFDSEGMFHGCDIPGYKNERDRPLRYTIWFAKGHYGQSGKGKFLKTPASDEIKKISLK